MRGGAACSGERGKQVKFRVTMNYPDTLHDAIREAVERELAAMENLDEDEREQLAETRADKVSDKCDRWFRYSEYLTVEIDTEAMTCVVVPEKP